jgi:hypothetical protein
MNSASLRSLAGRYDYPIPPRFLAPIDFLKIPAQVEGIAAVGEGYRSQSRPKQNEPKEFVKQKYVKRTLSSDPYREEKKFDYGFHTKLER